MVERKISGHMHTAADIVEQEASKIAFCRSKCDRIDPLAVCPAQCHPHMIPPDAPHIGQHMMRQRQQGLRMRRTIRTGFLQSFIKRHGRTGCSQRPIDGKALVFTQARHDIRGFFLQIGAQRAKIAALNGNARRHGMATALHQQALFHRTAHQLAQIKT